MRVVSMVVKEGMRSVLIGQVIGIAGALALTRLLASSLYGVHALDPLTFIVVPVSLLIVTLAACLVPGWKAAASNPMNALRCE